MTDAALAHNGYTWLSAPGAAALAILFVHQGSLGRAFGGALQGVADAPRHLWLRGPGGLLDEVIAARVARGVIVTCHGGPASRRAIEGALQQDGIAVTQTPPLWSSRTRVGTAAEALLPFAQGRLGMATVLAGLNTGETALRRMLAMPVERAIETLGALGQGRRVINPPRVQLWGPVNAGKSSLLNALCGAQLAAVAEEPGLTRDVIEGRYEHEGFVVRVFDAPGELADAHGIDQAAIELALRWKGEADLVLRLAPGGNHIRPGPREWSIHSRADEAPTRGALRVSVREPDTVDALKDRIAKHFIGRLRLLPLEQRVAPVPELLGDLRKWVSGRISCGDVESRWLAEAVE
jgi:hypothetical protein